MKAVDYATIVVAVVTVIGAIAASIRWMVKHYLSELKPDGNGGHNFEGRIARIEKTIDQILRTLLEKHV
jgi:hypothetical protein